METQPEYVLSPHLEPGERFLWTGRPRQGVRLVPQDAFLIPFSLLWGGFAFFWEYMVIRQGGPWFFALSGVPFVLIGTYMIVGRFFWDAKRRSAIAYAVTDRRVIIKSGVWRSSVRSVSLRTLSDVSMTEGRDGSGGILLGPAPPMTDWWAGTGWPGMRYSKAPVLERIPRVLEVHGLIRERQAAAV